MQFLIEITKFMLKRKKFWLYPIIFFLAFFGIIIVFFGQGSVLTPFIYTIF